MIKFFLKTSTIAGRVIVLLLLTTFILWLVALVCVLPFIWP